MGAYIRAHGFDLDGNGEAGVAFFTRSKHQYNTNGQAGIARSGASS